MMVDKATTQIQYDCGIRVLVFIKLIENKNLRTPL
ncbi:hypothetical protein [Staphylococcus aureus]|nr:hypothetical protein [Staphylococcus aureus]MCE3370506.1 hypothetical protein [Staphylococcus aureus]